MKEYGVTKSWTRLLIFPPFVGRLRGLNNVLFYSKGLKDDTCFHLSIVARTIMVYFIWYNEAHEYIIYRGD